MNKQTYFVIKEVKELKDLQALPLEELMAIHIKYLPVYKTKEGAEKNNPDNCPIWEITQE